MVLLEAMEEKRWCTAQGLAELLIDGACSVFHVLTLNREVMDGLSEFERSILVSTSE